MFLKETVESFFIVAAATAALVWYAVFLGRKEDREARSAKSGEAGSDKFPVAS